MAASSLVGRHPLWIWTAQTTASGTTGARSATTCATGVPIGGRRREHAVDSVGASTAPGATVAIAEPTVHSPLMTSAIILALAVFGASSVEMVEALTIVVASGATRGWRSALEGTAAAVLVLAVLVGAVGVPLVRLVPLDALRVIVGGLLLVLGLNWLRKAILRSSGHKALHDEDAIYARTVADLGGAHAGVVRRGSPRDSVGFMVAFKGVFLEGREVVMIVIT